MGSSCKDGILQTPGTVRWCRRLSYTRGMGWDIDEVRVDTLRMSDPKVRVGTITADKVRAGRFDLGAALTEEQIAYLRRAVMKGSS